LIFLLAMTPRLLPNLLAKTLSKQEATTLHVT
jgi:hypothetical protein